MTDHESDLPAPRDDPQTDTADAEMADEPGSDAVLTAKFEALRSVTNRHPRNAAAIAAALQPSRDAAAATAKILDGLPKVDYSQLVPKTNLAHLVPKADFSHLVPKIDIATHNLDFEPLYPAERLPMIDHTTTPQYRAAAAAERTAERLELLVDAALGAEQRETTMLRWTRAGVVLAAIAAVASIIAIIVTIVLA